MKISQKIVFQLFLCCHFLFSVIQSQEEVAREEDQVINSNIGYAALIDAGSAGTRVYIYSFNKQFPLESLVEVSSKRIKLGKDTSSLALFLSLFDIMRN